MAARGRLLAVCRSTRRGVTKEPVEMGLLRAGHGLEGDAHAGDWHRQLSLLDAGDIRDMEAKGIELAPGAFGENLIVTGLDTTSLGVGSRLAVGDAELRITQIGKECHERCAIYVTTGDCIMPRRGLFAEVLRGGRVAAGTPVEVLETVLRTAASARSDSDPHPEAPP
jgi:MOSC domain-containing protein YiiM